MAGKVTVPIRKRPAIECLGKVCKRPANTSHQEEEYDLEQESDVVEDQGRQRPEEDTDCDLDESMSSEPQDHGRTGRMWKHPLMNKVVENSQPEQ